MLKSLVIILTCLSGMAAALPRLQGTVLKLKDSPVKFEDFAFVTVPSDVKG